ncbi:hypothetical protein [Pradoshia sp.]
MKWVLIAIGIFLIFLITEEAITRYFYKLQKSIIRASDNTVTEKESP